MKKALFTLFAAFLAHFASAQCVGNPNIGTGIFPSGDSLPCAIVGQPYNFTFQFRSFDSVGPFVVVSTQIDSIAIQGGWQVQSTFTDKPSNIFLLNQSGCMGFMGIAPINASIDSVLFYVTLNVTGLPAPISGELGQLYSTFGINGQQFPVINTITPGSLCPTGYLNTLGYVKGQVYYDSDANGSFGAGDFPFANKALVMQPGNANIYTNAAGVYYGFLDPGNYTIALTPPTNYTISSSPTSYAVNLVSASDSAVGLNFGLIPTDTIYDLSIVATSSPTRPGFTSTHWLVYENLGTMPITSGSVTYTLDTTYTFNNAVPSYDLVNGNTYTWNFTDLLPSEQRTIALNLYLPPNIELMGDTLTSWGDIAPTDADDNTFINQTIVTASYDPNDKTPYPTEKLDEAFIDSEKPLMYRIRFQNTGTDTAFNITVRDTLDLDKFEVETVRLIGASHEYTFRIEEGNIAIWQFNNILLPDSNVNEPGSHGFILFELGLVPGLDHGDVVENRAGIYFDFNPVVITDYAVSRVDFSTGIGEVGGNDHISVYPNPVQDRLVILHEAWQQGSTFRLFDLSGKVVMAETLTATRTELNTTNLPNGMYLYRVAGANGTEGMGKVVVAR